MQIGKINTFQYYSYLKNNNSQKHHFENKKCEGQKTSLLYNIPFTSIYKNQPIYCVNRDGTVSKFNTKIQASQILGVNVGTVKKCLEKNNHESRGYTFLYADEVEIKNPDGTISINQSVINKAIEEFSKAKTTPIYAINQDGTYIRFNSLTSAAKELEILPSSISKSLLGASHSAGGFIFASAQDMELRDEKGMILYDDKNQPLINPEVKKAQLERFSNAYGAPVCAIDCFANITRFEDENEAFVDSSHKTKTVRDIEEEPKLNGGRIIVQENVIISRDENGFARTDENGNYLYDIDKINKLLQVFANIKIKPVKAVNIATGESFEFKSSTEAARVLGIAKQAIYANMKGINKSASGYRFEYLYPRRVENYNLTK